MFKNSTLNFHAKKYYMIFKVFKCRNWLEFSRQKLMDKNRVLSQCCRPKKCLKQSKLNSELCLSNSFVLLKILTKNEALFKCSIWFPSFGSKNYKRNIFVLSLVKHLSSWRSFDFTDVQASTKGKTFFEKLVKNISVMMFGVYF